MCIRDSPKTLAVLGVLALAILGGLAWVLVLQRQAMLEQRYQNLVENANDIIFTLDLKQTLTSLNQACLLYTSPVATYSNAGGLDALRRWLEDAIDEGVRRVRLAQLGVDQSRLSGVLAGVKVERFGLVSRDSKTGEIRAAGKKNEVAEFAVPFGLMLLLGMIVMVGSSPMLSAVTEDKAQRLVEMLLGMATPLSLIHI